MDTFTTIDKLKKDIIVSKSHISLHKLYPHEEILLDRLNGLVAYIKSLSPYIIIPSIIVCSKTQTIIDGHHRYYALKKLNLNIAPVTQINYLSKKIVTNTDNSIIKNNIIDTAKKRKLFSPKTTEHKIKDSNNYYPLILLSDLMIV